MFFLSLKANLKAADASWPEKRVFHYMVKGNVGKHIG